MKLAAAAVRSMDGQKRLEYLKVPPVAGLRSINAPVSNYFVMIIVTCPATMPDPTPDTNNLERAIRSKIIDGSPME